MDNKIKFITDHINLLNIHFRTEILQIILQSDTPRDKICEKGEGTQIKLKYISNSTLETIYNFIKIKSENTIL